MPHDVEAAAHVRHRQDIGFPARSIMGPMYSVSLLAVGMSWVVGVARGCAHPILLSGGRLAPGGLLRIMYLAWVTCSTRTNG